MKAMLGGINGPAEGVQVSLEEGCTVTVGRHAVCTLSVPGDNFLSGRHFQIREDAGRYLLLDLGSSNGTFVGDTRVTEHLLAAGETVRAGRSVFQLHCNKATVPTVFDLLSGLPQPLYAVLDTARDPAIYPFLLSNGAQCMTLYAGQSAVELVSVAPYLVYLPPQSNLLRDLVSRGWGNSWGIFLTSTQPPQTIWHELRRSLMVKLEHSGKFAYFRFYDPRVLRVFLPMADAKQISELAGTAGSLIMEGEDPAFLHHFHSFTGGCKSEVVEVRNPPAYPPASEEQLPSSQTLLMQTIQGHST